MKSPLLIATVITLSVTAASTSARAQPIPAAKSDICREGDLMSTTRNGIPMVCRCIWQTPLLPGLGVWHCEVKDLAELEGHEVFMLLPTPIDNQRKLPHPD